MHIQTSGNLVAVTSCGHGSLDEMGVELHLEQGFKFECLAGAQCTWVCQGRREGTGGRGQEGPTCTTLEQSGVRWPVRTRSSVKHDPVFTHLLNQQARGKERGVGSSGTGGSMKPGRGTPSFELSSVRLETRPITLLFKLMVPLDGPSGRSHVL